MREINPPPNLLQFEAVCEAVGNAYSSSSHIALLLWLAGLTKHTGTLIDIGCRNGARLAILHKMLSRFKRPMVGVEWSQEHRINEKQHRRVTPSFQVGAMARNLSGVRIIDADPVSVSYRDFQPLSFTFIDYDQSKKALLPLSNIILEETEATGMPNAIVAWMNYRHQQTDSPHNEVWRCVNSLNLPSSYFFAGRQLAFKVFNITEGLRIQLKEMAT